VSVTGEVYDWQASSRGLVGDYWIFFFHNFQPSSSSFFFGAVAFMAYFLGKAVLCL